MPSATPDKPWRSWYSKPRWSRLARHQLQSNPLCCMCLKEGKVVAASIADHVIPHRGDPQLFWFGALQSMCELHHKSYKQKQENKGYDSHIGNDGWPTDPLHPVNMNEKRKSFTHIPRGGIDTK